MPQRARGAMAAMKKLFRAFAQKTAEATGSVWAFAIAAAVIFAWGLTGPLFRFSDTWQLVINTGTTIVTFLMVFLIQNTQNRETKALHLKIDELIRANERARNRMLDLENLSDEELQQLEQEFRRLRGPYGDAAEERREHVAEELHDRDRARAIGDASR